ncbi:MAG: HpaII family restriction endonuclease [Bacteroidetes bacterium]|nr:HpaII family restriction endonuclease [Bacteroidota bacterium]
MPLRGNKGEWSEVYVFLKLLAEGRLNAADEHLNVNPNIFYPIIKILRQESSEQKQYCLNGNIRILDSNNVQLLSIPITEFVEKSRLLLRKIKSSSGRSLEFPEIELFLSNIFVNKLTADTSDKSDINIVVHDLTTGRQPLLGFSIKSMLGGKSTLFNPGAGTNFIYKFINNSGNAFYVEEFNNRTYRYSSDNNISKISYRLLEMERLGFEPKFFKIQSENLQMNLELIDSQLPLILSYIVYYKYKTGVSKMSELVNLLNNINPLRFNFANGHPYYEYKIKNFLTDNALGMTPETVWRGVYDATGGIIIVKEDGNIVCYHIYNRTEFQNYLFNNTKLEQASTSEDESNPGNVTESAPKPYKFGWVYEEEGEFYVKLNLQIRFI